MGRLIYLIVLVIDVIVVMDILQSNKDMEKILWIIAVIFLPILGPVLYYVIGKK